MINLKTASLSSAEPVDVVQAIGDLIQQRGMVPGEQLPPIRELAASMGVKPTVIRDGLLQAQAMGLVRVIPRFGTVVQAAPANAPRNSSSGNHAVNGEVGDEIFAESLSRREHNLFQLLDARRLLEVELAGRAAERRRLEDLLSVRRALESMLNMSPVSRREDYVEHDIAFHVEVARLADNRVMFAMYRSLLEVLRPHLSRLPWTPGAKDHTDSSHSAIYSALVAGNVETVREAMRNHLSMAYDCLLGEIQGLPQPTRPSEQARNNNV